jgi:hypothetical protein
MTALTFSVSLVAMIYSLFGMNLRSVGLIQQEPHIQCSVFPWDGGGRIPIPVRYRGS